ncbi:MAG: 3'-5' exonuclease [Candidatus Andersenbacteria bacterium]
MTKSFNLPDTFIVFDLEWTAWEGSQQRGWSEPNEYREVYDIGAVRVEGKDFDTTDTYRQLVTLRLTPSLPEYSRQLTGITQADIDRDGISFAEALRAFNAFTQGYELYNWGTGDPKAIAESCQLKNLSNPFEGRIHDIRPVFEQHGVPVEKYMSSTIVQYFGKENTRAAHQGLDDAMNIVEALRLLKMQNGLS